MYNIGFSRGRGADNSTSDLSGTCVQFRVSILGKAKVWVKNLQQTSQKLVIFQNSSDLSWRLLCESKTVTSYPWLFENSYIFFANIFHNRVKDVSLGNYPLFSCPLLWTKSCRWLLWCVNVIPFDLDLFVTHLLSFKSILASLWSEILNTVSEKICQSHKQVHERKMF